MNKPIATFTGGPTYYPVYDTETGQEREYAVVYGVDHPRLGKQDIAYTSLVEVKCEDGNSFETRNTLYKRAV